MNLTTPMNDPGTGLAQSTIDESQNVTLTGVRNAKAGKHADSLHGLPGHHTMLTDFSFCQIGCDLSATCPL
jgi:hypothetical protein